MGMTSAQIRAVIDDGPRRGETIVLDAEKNDAPPHEIMLPDGHAGVRDAEGHVPRPTGSVSTYRLVESAEGSGYHYKVVPHDRGGS
jgi:hypothetical protein